MPCYVCHGNPHDAGYKMHNEELDADLVTRTVTSQRLFCVACHREDDTSRATPSVVKKYLGFELKKLPPMGAAHKLGTTTPCTNCHLDEHKPVPGESQGGQACVDCHDSTDNTGYSGTISATMTAANNATFRHMISSTIAQYPAYGAGRTCLMCHVDHDKFSPVVVPTNTRAANLKRDGTAATTATVATASTDFNVTYAAGGTCASCHASQINKSYTRLNGSTRTVAISKTSYSVSEHNYPVPATYSSDDTVFNANCVKCHTDSFNATREDRWGASSTNKFETHSTTNTAAVFAEEEELCFACHRSAGEAYGAMTMPTWSNMVTIFTSVTAYRHPVNNATLAGRHQPNEGKSAGWASPTGTKRHVECADCHNPHAATASTHWNATYLRPTGSTAKKPLPGALQGVWGVSATFGAAWTTPSYNYKPTATLEAEICLKCHSAYGMGLTFATRSYPSATPPGTVVYRETEIGKEFNPANNAHHAMFAIGKNQPAESLNSANWTGAGRISGAWQRAGSGGNAISGSVTDAEYVGLSNNFVPPYKADSIITCSDCHDAYTLVSARGPHGSSRKWILKGLDTTILYTLGGGATVNYSAWAWNANDRNNFCLNCHRADVYSRDGFAYTGTAYSALSRFDHDTGDPQGSCGTMDNAYGIHCMNCHGGDASIGQTPAWGNPLGGAHGTNQADTAATYGNNVGKRFLNGACWNGHATATTVANSGSCYTKDNSDEVNTCTSHNGGGAGDYHGNYNY
jgi:hypothetical protein